jgi:hypothetical protein
MPQDRRRRATGWIVLALLAVCVCVPACPVETAELAHSDPLRPSAGEPGPCDAETLEGCIACCAEGFSPECVLWAQSVSDALDGRSQDSEGEKLRGVWLPTIDAVRAAARRIPLLKSVGMNAVSFGPDIVTRDVAEPRTVGDEAIRFYVRLFHTAGFAVYLIPNPMHWGNNDVSLHALTPLVIAWAEEAEAFGVELYGVMNEVDGMHEDRADTSEWLQAVLAPVRERYSGLICVQPTQAGFKSGELDVEGYDVVSPFFSLLVPDAVRNLREINAFSSEADRVRERHPSVQSVLLSDVATFSGGNWAETFLMESQARALAEGRSEYSSDAAQAAAYETFLNQAFPNVAGCFFNLWVGFDFLDRPAEDVVRSHFAVTGQLAPHPLDTVWSTPGLLEVLEGLMMTEEERALIFDLETYVAGWAGLCHEPSVAEPGPFGCTSTASCMETFREQPDAYWRLAGEDCAD